MMDDSFKFPPLDVIYDGEDFWLWDGFHRREAALASDPPCGIASCNVRPGTLIEAVWLPPRPALWILDREYVILNAMKQ